MLVASLMVSSLVGGLRTQKPRALGTLFEERRSARLSELSSRSRTLLLPGFLVARLRHRPLGRRTRGELAPDSLLQDGDPFHQRIIWLRRLGSNQRPTAYPAAALPTELLRNLVCVAGVEPATTRFQTEDSTRLSYTQKSGTGLPRRSFPRRRCSRSAAACVGKTISVVEVERNHHRVGVDTEDFLHGVLVAQTSAHGFGRFGVKDP